MSLAADEKLQRIEAAIEAEDLAPAPAVLIGYVLISEWAASDGDIYMIQSRPETQAYWRTLGLLKASEMSIQDDVRVVNEPDDDEDDDE